jgi:hypothetical protein
MTLRRVNGDPVFVPAHPDHAGETDKTRLPVMMARVFAKGYRAGNHRCILCSSLFWHALGIIWVALFTVVCLMGGAL